MKKILQLYGLLSSNFYSLFGMNNREKRNKRFFYLILSIDKNIVSNKRIYFNDNRCDWEQGFNNLAEYMEIDVSSSALLNEHSWLLFRIIIE